MSCMGPEQEQKAGMPSLKIKPPFSAAFYCSILFYFIFYAVLTKGEIFFFPPFEKLPSEASRYEIVNPLSHSGETF